MNYQVFYWLEKPEIQFSVYYTRNAAGQILLLVIYAKSVRASISGAVLKQIKEMLDHDD